MRFDGPTVALLAGNSVPAMGTLSDLANIPMSASRLMGSRPPPMMQQNVFATPGLSLGLQPNCSDMLQLEPKQSFLDADHIQTPHHSRSSKRKEEEIDSRSGSGSDNVGTMSGDEQGPPKKKRYHRHTALQIQQMEGLFKECPHPDDKQRQELSRELGLEPRQVKFWFQNRRTQLKAQQERAENSLLRVEIEKLRAENITMREAIRNASCPNCGGPATLREMSFEEQHLRIENACLKDELERVSAVAAKFFGRSVPPILSQAAPQFSNSSDLNLSMAAANPLPTAPPPPTPQQQQQQQQQQSMMLSNNMISSSNNNNSGNNNNIMDDISSSVTTKDELDKSGSSSNNNNSGGSVMDAAGMDQLVHHFCHPDAAPLWFPAL